MGYTLRTLARVADIVANLRELEQGERADDGWVEQGRLFLTTRTREAMGKAQFWKLVRIAREEGLIEKRTDIPRHLDQRLTHWRTTAAGRKSILDGQAIVSVIADRQVDGQTTIDI